ncbi:MAG: LapA family protein [Geminicoccaceae bacterium]
MSKLLTILIALVGALVIVVLSVDNRQTVDLVFWPLPFTHQLPLYVVFLIGLFAGALLGGMSTWLSAHASRRDARALRRKVRAVEYQERLTRERQEQEALEQARRKTKDLVLAAPHA